MSKAIKKPKFSELALTLLKDRYLWRDATGRITETPEDMLHRVADTVASAESGKRSDGETNKSYYARQFYNIMADLDFLPNSPTLMNAGRQSPHGQLAACFVIGVDDSMPSICEALRKQMLIHKTGGGTGFNFSNIRPEGSNVNSTNGRASGPVSFMRLFDLSTDIVQQGGMRRGANMAILNVDHPDIEKFISCKDEDGVIKNFNLSVGITDAFMRKVEADPESDEAKLFDKIAEHAWKSGDPGVVFMDTINRDNPCPELGRINSTNPCGESPLLANEACNLGSINVSHMFDPETKSINFGKLKRVAKLATRMLDDIISVGQYPLPEIEEAVKRTRKIGLGIMGFADLLIKMRVPYNSSRAFTIAQMLIAFIRKTAQDTSEDLGFEKGFPQGGVKLNRRNATLTCIAPTGTLSLLAGCSSGIEPIFSLKHTRRVTTIDGNVINTVINHPLYEEMLEDKSMTSDEIDKICVTAYKLSPETHIKMQGIFQQYTDLAVSKTINLPHDATVDQIKEVYKLAWKLGCKGTTVYRDRCKSIQVLTEVK